MKQLSMPYKSSFLEGMLPGLNFSFFLEPCKNIHQICFPATGNPRMNLPRVNQSMKAWSKRYYNTLVNLRWFWVHYIPFRQTCLGFSTFPLCRQLNQISRAYRPSSLVGCLQTWSEATQPNPQGYIPWTIPGKSCCFVYVLDQTQSWLSIVHHHLLCNLETSAMINIILDVILDLRSFILDLSS